MILNESGINKVVNYLGDDHCKYVRMNGRDLLLGIFSEDDIKKLNDINVELKCIGGGLHEVMLEQEELDSLEVNNKDDMELDRDISQEEVKKLANMLMPYIERAFPTKEEVNDVIEKLTAQMIDPDEMIDGLKKQIKRIKKQSRADDEVG